MRLWDPWVVIFAMYANAALLAFARCTFCMKWAFMCPFTRRDEHSTLVFNALSFLLLSTLLKLGIVLSVPGGMHIFTVLFFNNADSSVARSLYVGRAR